MRTSAGSWCASEFGVRYAIRSATKANCEPDPELWLLRLDARLLHHLAPGVRLGLAELGELLGRAGRGLQALLGEQLLHLGGVERLDELLVQALEDLLRGLRRRVIAVPVGRLVARVARLGDGRH